MTLDLEALVVAAYLFADEYQAPLMYGRPPLVTDAELVALAVGQAAIGISSDRQFLGLVERVLPGWFPHLPDQSQYNRRLRGLVELMSHVQERLARLVDVGGIRLADGTALAVASYAGCEKRSHFSGFARYGYAKSEHRFIWGVRLLTGTPAEVVIADKGFWGESFRTRLAADGVRLLTPNKTRTATNLAFERALASTRLVIESVFANLKGQMQLERHLARTPAGLALRIAQRILALTVGILLNTLAGRPARALAIYDGR